MSNEIAIKVENLSKCYEIYDHPRDRLKQFLLPHLQRALGQPAKPYYREFWALKDVSFQVNKGETVGIIGRNGSGKSTLLQMICGTLTPSSGVIETQGRIAALLELGAGFNPEFTGRENVFLNGAVFGLSQNEIEQKFDDIAAFADIGDFINQPVKTYSSGMYVRLAFSVIAHVDADILIIDEALAVGDAYFTQKCMRFMRRFKDENTLVFVSHDSAAVTGLCEKALWLEKGALKMRGRAKNVTEAYLASLYDSSPHAGSCNTKPTAAVSRDNDALNGHNVDPRLELLNRSTLRNDIEVFQFSPGASADFGLRGAEITTIELLDSKNEKVNLVVGGETLTLFVGVRALRDLDLPIVGFSVKDRLGQVLFGDNTFLSYGESAPSVKNGECLVARFLFQMPILPPGDYSIAVAVATGTQHDHVQHHWVHDALILKSISSSVSTGLIGIPMQEITLTVNHIDNL